MGAVMDSPLGRHRRSGESARQLPCVNGLGQTPAKAFLLAGRYTQLLTAVFTADLGSLLSRTGVNSSVTMTTIQQPYNLANEHRESGAPAPRPTQEATAHKTTQNPTSQQHQQPHDQPHLITSTAALLTCTCIHKSAS
jgi:hypothetical protein